MQATQSSTGLGVGSDSPRLVALRSVNESLENPDRGAVGAPVSVAEGAGLAHDLGNLLEALGLYADLLAWDGVARHHEERPMRLVEAEAGWIAC